jgi:hypothetical protein
VAEDEDQVTPPSSEYADLPLAPTTTIREPLEAMSFVVKVKTEDNPETRVQVTPSDDDASRPAVDAEHT